MVATSGRGSGMVAYNVQSAVDTTNHLIVAHEVTNVGITSEIILTVLPGRSLIRAIVRELRAVQDAAATTPSEARRTSGPRAI